MKRKPDKILDINQTLDLVNKQWATTNDIMQLGFVCYSNARKVSNVIKNNLVEKGYSLPRGLVPMKEVVKFFNIDINYLKKIKNND